MPYIMPEVIAEAKQMDLLTYLQNYEPHELVRVSGNIYSTRTHDSLKISNGKWCWFSRGIGGRSALDYLIKVRGMDFLDAVECIMGNVAVLPPSMQSTEQSQPRPFKLPTVSRDATQMVMYLRGRGIDFDILHFCIDSGLLYESYPHHNAVFVGMDENGKPRYAALRGEKFMGEASGSDKHYAFKVSAREESDTLYLFESPIDLLSYATLLKLHEKDWRQHTLLSLSGVYRPKENARESKVPAALQCFLEDNPRTRNIVLCFDNDTTGRLAVETIRAVLPERYEITAQPPPNGKDYNDYLCDCLQIPRSQSHERNHAR